MIGGAETAIRGASVMNKIPVSIVLIISLIGCSAASGYFMRPGEFEAEKRFEEGRGPPWIGGDPPCWGPWCYGYPHYSPIYREYPPSKYIGAPYHGYSRISLFPECFPFCDGYPFFNWRCQYCYPRSDYYGCKFCK